MRDEIAFSVAPWIAAACFLATAVFRYVRSRDGRKPAWGQARRTEPAAPLSGWWRYSIAAVLLGHVLAVAFPGALLLWDRQAVRLIALESIGVVVALIALGSLIAGATRWRWWGDRRSAPSPVDVVAVTLLLLDLGSGLATATRYRWASSWSAVTLAPYLRSLLTLQPSTALVVHLPFLVKLHVVSAFALFAVMPLTTLAGTAAAIVPGLLRVAVTPVLAAGRGALVRKRGGSGPASHPGDVPS